MISTFRVNFRRNPLLYQKLDYNGIMNEYALIFIYAPNEHCASSAHICYIVTGMDKS